MPLYTRCTSLMSVRGDSQSFTKRETVPWHCDRERCTLLEQGSSANTLTIARSTQQREVQSWDCTHCREDAHVYICMYIGSFGTGKAGKQPNATTEWQHSCFLCGLKSRPARETAILGHIRSTSKCLAAKARRSWYSDLGYDHFHLHSLLITIHYQLYTWFQICEPGTARVFLSRDLQICFCRLTTNMSGQFALFLEMFGIIKD